MTLSRDLHVSEKLFSFSMMLIASNSKIVLRLLSFILCVFASGFVLQSMAELLAENYHNIWAKKKKLELEAKGTSRTSEIRALTHNLICLFFKYFFFFREK